MGNFLGYWIVAYGITVKLCRYFSLFPEASRNIHRGGRTPGLLLWHMQEWDIGTKHPLYQQPDGSNQVKVKAAAIGVLLVLLASNIMKVQGLFWLLLTVYPLSLVHILTTNTSVLGCTSFFLHKLHFMLEWRNNIKKCAQWRNKTK
jgi:hypothetical protein